MKRLLTLVALAATLTASAQVKVVKLWDNASAPHSNEDAGPQKEKNGNLYNTVDTELFIYPAAPDKATGQAVVVCPGGGYRFVSMPREGHEVGEWLSAEGITVVALKYRLPNGHCQVPLEDAEAALRYIRDHAAEYGVDPSRVGIMGFSAGIWPLRPPRCSPKRYAPPSPYWSTPSSQPSRANATRDRSTTCWAPTARPATRRNGRCKTA